MLPVVSERLLSVVFTRKKRKLHWAPSVLNKTFPLVVGLARVDILLGLLVGLDMDSIDEIKKPTREEEVVMPGASSED